MTVAYVCTNIYIMLSRAAAASYVCEIAKDLCVGCTTNVFAVEFGETIDRNDINICICGRWWWLLFTPRLEDNNLPHINWGEQCLQRNITNPYKCATALLKLDSNANSSACFIRDGYSIKLLSSSTNGSFWFVWITPILWLLLFLENGIHFHLFAS